MASQPFRKRWHISEFLANDEAQQQRLVLGARRAMGEWFSGDFVWHHFVTLTFAPRPREEDRLLRPRGWMPHDPTEAGALGQLRRWIRRLEKRAQRGVGWVAALERGGAGRLHLHVLTAHTQHLTSCALVKAWPCGRADASPYDPSMGAAHYIAKGVGSCDVDFTFDIAPAHKLTRVVQTLDGVVGADGAL